MRSSTHFFAATTLVAAMVLGCGGPAPVTQTAPAPASKEQADSAAVAKAKADSLRYPYTQADVDFMSAMIGHHAQALVMAGWAPTHGASPAVRTLAERIINAQQDEIGSMQRWLQDRRQPVPEASRMGGTGQPPGAGHGHSHHGMPGHAHRGADEAAGAGEGPEFDRLFLTFMIQHHKGAVTMVEELFGTPGAARGRDRVQVRQRRQCGPAHRGRPDGEDARPAGFQFRQSVITPPLKERTMVSSQLRSLSLAAGLLSAVACASSTSQLRRRPVA